jgi:hypothetical protein
MVPSKVLNLMAFVPARDFELSRRFYHDLGFHENWGNDQACEFELEGFRFLLQNFYVKDHAGNFMMSLMVETRTSGGSSSRIAAWRRSMSYTWRRRRSCSRGDCACCT